MTASNYPYNPQYPVEASDFCLINEKSDTLAAIAPDLRILMACKNTIYAVFTQQAFVEFPMAYCWEMMKQCAALANATDKRVHVPMAYHCFLWIKPNVTNAELEAEHSVVCDTLSAANKVWVASLPKDFRDFSIL